MHNGDTQWSCQYTEVLSLLSTQREKGKRKPSAMTPKSKQLLWLAGAGSKAGQKSIFINRRVVDPCCFSSIYCLLRSVASCKFLLPKSRASMKAPFKVQQRTVVQHLLAAKELLCSTQCTPSFSLHEMGNFPPLRLFWIKIYWQSIRKLHFECSAVCCCSTKNIQAIALPHPHVDVSKDGIDNQQR